MESFLCPLSKKLMVDPVIGQNGKCYERSALNERSFKNDGVLGNFLVDPTRHIPDKKTLVQIEQLVPTLEEKDQKEWKKRQKEKLVAEKIDAKEYAVKGALREAAELGDKKSKILIAKQCYVEGKHAEGLELLLSIPDKDKTNEVYNLLGDGYASLDDFANTAKWYYKAGDSSHSDSLWKLSEFCCKLERFSDAHRASMKATKVAGLRGKPNHIRRIAEFYRDGISVKQDLAKANEWYKQLAACGDANAIYYFAEDSVEKEDFVGCVRKLVSASKKGHEEASEKLEQVKDLLNELFPGKRKRSGSVA